jgi:hypothetical protein
VAQRPDRAHLDHSLVPRRHPDGGAAGVVVIASHGLLHARLKASLAGADRELGFVSGERLDAESSRQVPANNDRPVLGPWRPPEAAPDADQEKAAGTISATAGGH